MRRMSSTHEWMSPASTVLATLGDRGAILVLDGAVGDADAATLAQGAGLELAEVHARSWGNITDGVARACAPEFLPGPHGGGDLGFCADAAGEGVGAARAWRSLQLRWSGVGESDGLPMPPDDQGFRRCTEILARILSEIGAVSGRFVLVRNASQMDEGSTRAFTSLLAGRGGAGWVLALEGPIEHALHVEAMIGTVERAADDGARVARLTPPPPADDDGPNLPQRGSSVELLDILAAAPGCLPIDVVGSASLAAYRGMSPRSGWLDLQGLLDSGRASADGPVIRLAGDWTPSTDPDSAVARADCRALRTSVEEVLPSDSPLAATLSAELAIAGGARDAADQAASAGRAALGAGDARAAARWLSRARGSSDAEVPALRARAARQSGDAEEARRLALEGLQTGPGADVSSLLHLEAALAALATGRVAASRRHAADAAAAADTIDQPPLTAACKLLLGQMQEEDGDYGTAAKTLGAAAQAAERAGLGPEAARALAWRAVCMGKAGAGPRAMKELQLARERAADPDDPHPAALDVRVLMGLVFRDSGSRENARKALAMAATKAAEHADPVREADARLLLAKFFLEAIPIRGPERGEALRAGREAADAVIQIARGMGRADLEAEGEALLGELSYRAEDWASALGSLTRQGVLWALVGRANQQVDVAIRRSRLTGRKGDHEGAFKAANEALMLATKRRLPEQSAQAQLARADALQMLDRSSDALAALSEAQRIFTGLGDGFAAQAAAAEERARNLVAEARG